MTAGRARVLVVGALGQLGKALVSSCPQALDCLAVDREELDITDEVAVERAMMTASPDWVINAAAYTAVDRAESEPELAAAINADGAAHLAQALQPLQGRLIQVSTDFVFNGRSSTPYPVDAPVDPIGVYGRTKADGELRVLETLADRALVLRTAWLYSIVGPSFVATMLRLMAERDQIGVVADQVGSPTSASSLAGAIWRVIAHGGLSGIYHWTDAGVASWYDFAVAVQRLAVDLGLLQRSIPVHPIGTSDHPTPARRPAYSVLDKMVSYRQLGEARHWFDELEQRMSAHARGE